MELELYQYAIAIVGGMVAGCINTLAGNGSAITLSILTEVMGLPGNMANGSNRVGVLSGCLASTYSFHKNGRLPLARSKFLVTIICIGALAGVYVASVVTNDQFKTVFKYMLLVMLLVILVKPKRWLIETDLEHKIPLIVSLPLFFCLGFYGGFIQMGMGVFFLAIMVLVAKYNIIDANAVKSFTVMLYTIGVLAYFHYKGLVNWQAGAILAVGQVIGGYLTAQYASQYKGVEIWAYRLLVTIVILVILRLFGILPF